MEENRFFHLIMYVCAAALTIFLLLRFLLPVLLPFLIGGLFALLADRPAARIADRLHLSRGLAAVPVLLLLFAMLAALLWVLAEAASNGLSRLVHQLPAWLETLRPAMASLRETLLRLAARLPGTLAEAAEEWIESLFSGTSALPERGSALLLSLTGKLVSDLPAVFLFLVTAVVSGFMIAAERETLRRTLSDRLPDAWQARLRDVGGHLRRSLRGWLRAELRMMGVTFVLVSLGLLLLGVRAPLLFGALTALVDALPVLGTGTVLIPWGLVELLRGETFTGLGLLILYAVAAAMRTALEPRLVGRQLGLDPLLSLFAMYAGFRFFGVAGLILLPLLTVLARQIWTFSA